MSEQKKGRKSWQPAQRLQVRGKRPGYVQRWVSKEPDNLARRTADGYTPVNATLGSPAQHDHPDLTGDGKRLTSVQEYRDMVLMEIPEEDYQSHRDYYTKETQKQTAGLKRNAVTENEKNAAGRVTPAHIYGKTVIE